MKIAVASSGTHLDSPIDPEFGNESHILIVDTFTFGVEVLNGSENTNGDLGPSLAAVIGDKGARILMIGSCGANAFQILCDAKIKVAKDLKGTVRDAVTAFNEGRVTFADTANS